MNNDTWHHPLHVDGRWRARWRAARGLAGTLLLTMAGAGPAEAQDRPAEFDSFTPPAARAARVFVAVDAWERIARPADRFGPRPLREIDRSLIDAARAERWAQVLDLVTQRGADPGAVDPRGTNVLALASKAGQYELVRDLLRHGAAIDRRGHDGFTPLGAAAFHGHASLVRLLLKSGADPLVYGSTGQTALHLATLAGRVGVVDTMLRLKVHHDQLNARRETALDLAAQGGQVEVMGRLLAAGADMTRAGER